MACLLSARAPSQAAFCLPLGPATQCHVSPQGVRHVCLFPQQGSSAGSLLSSRALLPGGRVSESPKDSKVGSSHGRKKAVACAIAGGETGELAVEVQRERERARSLPTLGGVMTDATVPEGHMGLHGFLYGDSGADVHDEETNGYSLRAGEDDGTTIVPFDRYVADRDAKRFAGVYAVYDAEGVLQYAGYSRSVVLSLKGHRTARGSRLCAGVKVRMYTDSALVSRTRLEEERQKWIQEATTLPPGNGPELHLWEGPNGPGTAAMSEAERSEYEEKKLKMRKAMGENLYDDVEGESEDSRTRRLRLLQATEGDNWSAVIDGQTKESMENPQTVRGENPLQAADSSAGPSGQIVSPFARPGGPSLGAPPGAEAAEEELLELTVSTVDRALDEVRPYLIADGGNVEVVGVEDGVVLLRLQGACGTCPSSTSTMKMGIERSLQNKFGSLLKEVMQVDKQQLGATIEGVEGLLDTLRPAIRNFKGRVEVVEVDPLRATCALKYEGPPPVGMGIQAAIRDKFPDIRTVKLLSF